MHIQLCVLIIIIQFSTITIAINKCEENDSGKCFKDYRFKINNELKPHMQEEFNQLLGRYSQLDNELSALLNLSVLIENLEGTLEKHSIENKDVFVLTNEISKKNSNINDTVHNLSKEIDKLIFDQKYTDDFEILINQARYDVEAITKGPIVNEVKHYINDKVNRDGYLMIPTNIFDKSFNFSNLPYNIVTDIEMLEKLLMIPEKDINCLKQRSDTLKQMFSRIVGLLNDTFPITIKETIANNNKNGNAILMKTEYFINNEQEYKNVHDLLIKTEKIAEKLSNLLDDITNFKINDLSKDMDVKKQLLDIEKKFNESLNDLDQKYSKLFEYDDEIKKLQADLTDYQKSIDKYYSLIDNC